MQAAHMASMARFLDGFCRLRVTGFDSTVRVIAHPLYQPSASSEKQPMLIFLSVCDVPICR